MQSIPLRRYVRVPVSLRALFFLPLAVLLVTGCGDLLRSENAQLEGGWLLRRADINQRIYRLDISQSDSALSGDAELLVAAPDSVSRTATLTGLIDDGDVDMTITHASDDTVRFDGYFTSDDEPGYAIEGDLTGAIISDGPHYLQRSDN